MNDAVVSLRRAAPPTTRAPTLVRADIVPSHGMLVLQLTARVPELGDVPLLATPPLEQALAILGAGNANATFSMGGAILLPFANRLRGAPSDEGSAITCECNSCAVTLPTNCRGSAADSEACALHGLAFDLPVARVTRSTDHDADRITASFDAGNFGGRWFAATRLTYDYALCDDAFVLRITACNVGDETLPMAIGWHPYFTLPSGDRSQARLSVPAAARVVVNNYDDVFPTGEIVPVRDTRYDFGAHGGRTLGDTHLDDCFTDLARDTSQVIACEITDPSSRLGVRISTTTPEIRAIQVYAPTNAPFVAIEPQYNLADPCGAIWGHGRDGGLVMLAPAACTTYEVRVAPITAPSSP